jgi:endonuclease/exonuclease/phosphatase family metal-dependent hydrolase
MKKGWKDSMKKKVWKSIGIIIGAILLIVLGYLAYVLISYHRLDDNLSLPVEHAGETSSLEQVSAGTTYRISSANVGFGAYSDDYSFFMDGGDESRARSEEAVIENISGSIGAVTDLDADIMLFQELDTDGTRSYHVDEKELTIGLLTEKGFSDITYTFAENYDSPYLFYPITEPHGKNQAGILTVSDFEITEGLRRSLPIEDGFMKFLDLDRCYSKQRIPVENGKELIVYNLHLSAYTSDPSTATNQLVLLFDDMTEEYEAGNYVVGGGDFNKDLLGNSAEIFHCGELEDNWAQPVPEELIPEEIQLVAPFDEADPVPSCRNADEPYDEDSFVLTVDGFLASANVEALNADVLDTGFQWSDHNPVYMDFRLNE